MIREPLRHESGVVAASFSGIATVLPRPRGMEVSAFGMLRAARRSTAFSATTMILTPQVSVPMADVSSPPLHVTPLTSGMRRAADRLANRCASMATPVGPEFSADGRRVVTGAEEKSARVWDAETGRPASELLPHGDHLVAATFTPGDRYVATACWGGMMKVWESAAGKLAGETLLKGAVADRPFTRFSADGTRVVTASLDNTARLWDAETGKSVGEPLPHQNRVVSASLSPDGRRVVTASWDKTAAIWDVAVDVTSPLPLWVPELAGDTRRELLPQCLILVRIGVEKR